VLGPTSRTLLAGRLDVNNPGYRNVTLINCEVYIQLDQKA